MGNNFCIQQAVTCITDGQHGNDCDETYYAEKIISLDGTVRLIDAGDQKAETECKDREFCRVGYRKSYGSDYFDMVWGDNSQKDKYDEIFECIPDDTASRIYMAYEKTDGGLWPAIWDRVYCVERDLEAEIQGSITFPDEISDKSGNIRLQLLSGESSLLESCSLQTRCSYLNSVKRTALFIPQALPFGLGNNFEQ